MVCTTRVFVKRKKMTSSNGTLPKAIPSDLAGLIVQTVPSAVESASTQIEGWDRYTKPPGSAVLPQKLPADEPLQHNGRKRPRHFEHQ